MTAYLGPRVVVLGMPVHALLVPIPIICFTGALLTDIAYANSAQVQWSNFSAWLLAFGTLFAAVAAVFGFIDLIGSRLGHRPAIVWWHMGGNLVVFVLALVNNFVHARDGWTSVVPTGLTLSAVTVALMAVTVLLGRLLVYRHVPGGSYAGERP